MARSASAPDARLWVDLAALLGSAAFAGIALGITCVEQPARMRLSAERSPKEALLQWAASYQQAAPIQASLAILTTAFGGVGAWLGKRAGRPFDRAWLVGCLLVGVNVPLTLLCIMPINDRLALRAARALEQEEEMVKAGAGGGSGKAQADAAAAAEEEAAEEGEGGSCPTLCFGAFAIKGLPSTTLLLRGRGYAHAVRTVLGCAGFGVLAYEAVVARRGGGRA